MSQARVGQQEDHIAREHFKQSDHPAWNQQRTPKRARPLTPELLEPNGSATPACLKAMFVFDESGKVSLTPAQEHVGQPVRELLASPSTRKKRRQARDKHKAIFAQEGGVAQPETEGLPCSGSVLGNAQGLQSGTVHPQQAQQPTAKGGNAVWRGRVDTQRCALPSRAWHISACATTLTPRARWTRLLEEETRHCDEAAAEEKARCFAVGRSVGENDGPACPKPSSSATIERIRGTSVRAHVCNARHRSLQPILHVSPKQRS